MATSEHLVDALKSALKQRRLTYRDVGEGLRVSESTVKRWFSDRSFSLGEIDRICALMDIELSGLLQLMRYQGELAESLTEDQERAIVADVRLLLVTFLVLHAYTAEQILGEYHLTKAELFKRLRQLDTLKVIELLPNDRVRALISPNFRWLPAGPIQRYFESRVRETFFTGAFDQPGEIHRFAYGQLSEQAIVQISRRIGQLVREYEGVNQEDRALPYDVRHGTSLLVAFRRWSFPEFEQLRRPRRTGDAQS